MAFINIPKGKQDRPQDRPCNLKFKNISDIKYWVFDLDNTLYPSHCNLFSQMSSRMTSFIENELTLSQEDAFALQKKYFKDFGTTLRGLMENHNICPKYYLDYVHDIDLSIVESNIKLDQILQELPGHKYIFTNADRNHAQRVMKKLGIEKNFKDIFDISDGDFMPKPHLSTYQSFVHRFGIVPEDSIMLDDMAKNLVPAADLGMTTVWIMTDALWAQPDGRQGSVDKVHYQTEDLTAWLETQLCPS